jgi:tetratricopeptide (TPR) repeat protein
LVEAMINVAAKETNERTKRTKYAEAKAEAEKLLAANPSSLDARYLVGRTALGAGEFDESIRVFDEVLGKQPRHCHAMANLGKAHVAKEEWSKAAAALERATDCDSGMNLAWESLGFVRQKMASGSNDFSVQQRYYQQAIAAYEKANAIKSTSSLAKAIADCQHNIDVSRENQAIARAEAEQDAAIEEEQQRREEEERKRREWQTRRDDG